MVRALSCALVLAFAPTAKGAPVTYELEPPVPGTNLVVTVLADDGVAMESVTRTLRMQNGEVSGDLSGVLSPLLTIEYIEYSFSDLLIDFTIGAAEIPVTLDLSGFLGWTPTLNNQVSLGQELNFGPGDVSDASYVGMLSTPFGALPFDLTEADGDTLDTQLVLCSTFQGSVNPCRFALKFYFDGVDTVALDDRESPAFHSFATENSFEAAVGEAGGITWRVAVGVAFQETSYVVPEPSAAALSCFALLTLGLLRARRAGSHGDLS